MKKKLRLRLSRVISSFQTCREKTSASALPPVFSLSPSNPKKFDIEFPTPTPPRPSPSRRIAAVVASTAGCRSCAPMMSPVRPHLSPAVDLGEDDMSRARETPAYLWRKEEKWHVVTSCAEEFERRSKIDFEDEDEDDLFPSSVRKMAARRRKREIEIRRRRRHRKSTSKSRNSTSSLASGSWFSSDDDEENDEREDNDYYNKEDDGDDTDTLLSSRSFSTDNSSGIKNRRHRCPSSPEPSRSSGAAAAMLSRLVPCGVDQGKVKESFAVVKKSEDPRGDFRRSMAEMVVEKGIYDAADLEQLLHCFLSLNSLQHHRAIVAAFADIWEALFPENSPHISSHVPVGEGSG